MKYQFFAISDPKIGQNVKFDFLALFWPMDSMASAAITFVIFSYFNILQFLKQCLGGILVPGDQN